MPNNAKAQPLCGLCPGPSLPLDAEHDCMKLPKHVCLQVKHRGAMYLAHEPGIWAFSAMPF